ncbi:MAG: sensor histidine kinase [Firmicutes bacterium]|nr:sensor histidine kinase [Bacillota bacterium]
MAPKFKFQWPKFSPSKAVPWGRGRERIARNARSRARNIAQNYFLAFIFIIVFPVFILNLVFNNFYVNTLLKNASERTLQTLEQIAIGIESETRRASLMAATAANDDELIELATSWNRSVDSNLKYTFSARIDAKLNFLFNYSNDIHSVIFIFKDQQKYYCYKNLPVFMPLALTKVDGYQQALENSGKVVLTGSLENFFPNLNNRYLYSAWIKPVIASYRNDVELIYFAFRTKVIDNLYSGLTNPIGDILITDAGGRIIGPHYQSLPDKDYGKLNYIRGLSSTKNHSFTVTINQQKMFVSSFPMRKPPWKIINFINYRAITNDVERVWRFLTIAFGLLILLFLGFTLVFFRKIILPLRSLSHQMQLVEQGDFHAQIAVKGNDEIAQLGQSFNKMVAEINKLVLERDLKERARSQAELETLKSQINPHFIANTLNSIRLMAMIAKVDSIKKMTEAFMKLLTATLGKDATMITVAEELENLQNYVYIMKVRYGAKFEVEFHIDEAIRQYHLLKLVLQPIVENAILHGVSELEDRKGLIQITGARTENNLLFTVTDNGTGMSPELIRKMLSEDYQNPKGFNSMGINNVDRRIKLHHGAGYGLEITSAPGQGATVKIHLPLILEDKDVKT